ncbi:MAG: hypothetical protein R6U96_04825 [Promethearchaeia archaeon]
MDDNQVQREIARIAGLVFGGSVRPVHLGEQFVRNYEFLAL